MRQFIKILLFTTLSLALAAIFSSFLLVSPFTHGVVERLVNNKLEPLHLTIRCERFELSWLPLRLSAYGLSLSATPAAGLSNRITIKKVRAEASRWSLIMGTPELDALRVDDASIHLGTLNSLLDLLPPSPPEQGTDDKKLAKKSDFIAPFRHVPIRLIQLKNTLAYVSYQKSAGPGSPATQFELSMAPSELLLVKTAGKEIFISPRLQHLSLRKNGKTLATDLNFTSTLRVEAQQISSNNAVLRVGQGEIAGSFSLSALMKNQQRSLFLHSAWRGELDLAPLESLVELKKTQGRFEGAFEIDGDIPANTADWGIYSTVHGTVHDGYIDGFHIFDSSVHLSIDKNKLLFDDISISTQGTQLVAGKGSLEFTGKMPMAFSVRKVDIGLAALLGALDVDFNAIDLDLNSSSLEIRGQADPLFLGIKAKAQINKLHITDFPRLNKGLSTLKNCRADIDISVEAHKTAFAPLPLLCGSGDNSKENHLELSGTIFHDPLKGIDLRLRGEQINLNLVKHTLPFAASGHTDAEVHIAGPFEKIVSTLTVKGQHASLNNAAVQSFAAGLSISEKELSWQQAEINFSDTSRVHSPAGTLQLDDLSSTFTAEAQHLEATTIAHILEPYPALKPYGVDAKNISLDFRGRIMVPSTYRGQVKADFGKITHDTTVLGDALSFALTRTDQGLQLNGGRYQRDTAEMDLTLALRPRKNSRVRGSALTWEHAAKVPLWQLFGFTRDDEVSLSLANTAQGANANAVIPTQLGALPFVGPYLQQAAISGALSLQMQLDGTIAAPEGHLQGSVEELQLLGTALMPLSFFGRVHQGILEINLHQPGKALEGEVKINFADTLVPYSWKLNFNQLELRALAMPIISHDPLNYAYVSGTWNMNGALSNWWHSSGLLHLKEIQAHYQGHFAERGKSIHLRTPHEAQVEISPQGWRFLPNQALELRGDKVAIYTSLGESHPPDKLDLSAHADIDLSLLEAVFSQVETATGKASLRAGVRGTIATPEVYGTLESTKETTTKAEDITFGLSGFKPAFRDIDFALSLEHGMLSLDRLRAQKGGGVLTATGKLPLLEDEHATGAFVTAKFQRLKVNYPAPIIKEIEALLSGSLQISREHGPFAISGSVHLDQVQAKEKIDLNRDLITWLRQERVRIDNRQVGFGPAIKYQIAIKGEKTITIKNEDADLLLSAALELVGDNNKPNLLGAIKADQGMVNFKQKFTIKHADILFNDPVKINPQLEIQAEASVDKRTVTVLITGDAEHPVVEVGVNPPQHDDGRTITPQEALILVSSGTLPVATNESALVNGKNAAPQSEETQSLALRGAGLAAAANYAGATPLDYFSTLLSQKYFRIYPEIIADDQGAFDLQLVAPLKLTEKVDAVVKGSQKSLKAALEVAIHDRITLSGSISRDAEPKTKSSTTQELENGSIDLRFKIPFK